MEEKINIIATQLGEIRIKKNIDLKDYLQSKSAGVASALYIATSIQELTRAINLCKELNINFLLFGSGSKIVMTKKKFKGLVIKNRSRNLKVFGIKGKISRAGIGINEAFIEADTGVTLVDLAQFSLTQGLGGFEDLLMMKGTIGGSILNNLSLRKNLINTRVLDESGMQKMKNLNEVSSHDVILKTVFHLKAVKKFNN